MRINKINQDTLLIIEKDDSYIASIIKIIFFIGLWYILLYLLAPSPFKEPFLMLFWFAPLLVIIQEKDNIKYAIKGKKILFDRINDTIHQNKLIVGKISDIDRLQIRKIHNFDVPNEYRISIVFRDRNKLKITQLSDFSKLHKLAKDLTNFLNIELSVKK